MKKTIALLSVWILPLFALGAETVGSNRTLTALEVYIFRFIDLINRAIVPLIFTIAFLVFIWGVYVFFIGSNGNEEKRKEGRSFILWGLIGFFVMVSVWGLVNLLVYTFGFDPAGTGNSVRPGLPRF